MQQLIYRLVSLHRALKSKFWAQVFIVHSRYLIGGAFVFASLIKIKGKRFTRDSGADYPIDTAWHFFETMYQSGLYWQFIGLGQLIAGLLLMTQRFGMLGALAFLPIIGNIFVVTISYDFNYTPVITGLMLLANIMLVLWDWEKLKPLFTRKFVSVPSFRLEQQEVWEVTGAMLFLFTAGYRVLIDQYDLFLWFATCLIIGLGGFITAVVRRRGDGSSNSDAGSAAHSPG